MLNAEPVVVDAGGENTEGHPKTADGAPVVDPAEPASAPAGDASGAALASDTGAGADDNPSATPVVAARAPIPPTKPAIFASHGRATDTTLPKASKSMPGLVPSRGVFVQVAAQKSKSAAKSTYRGLQAKFPTILGKLYPDFQRVSLGDKGVYYRVRIGPFAVADARMICGSYKAAGGDDCLIAPH